MSHETVWDLFAEVAASLSDEDVARLPKDGAREHDHYIYGTRKKYENVSENIEEETTE